MGQSAPVAVKAISVVRLTRTIDAESVELSNGRPLFPGTRCASNEKLRFSYWAEFYDSGGCWASRCSKNTISTCVAWAEKTLKFTPSEVNVGPSG